ncbi:ligase-associated DNA damage response endonuclease PdeM [Alteromonas lipolytica]|uniref:Calcineurin-like phosphoesterase domain-containing protein n=1 Tax=Alteromonas lipolytica TaxID=1856405 RepID=A0A1E8F8X1_9ALTE|nr:ligase-associated DNA damage response endonuclease PdeM [Alteromonas lipolytica]OFI32371.1 hypothetical protein BFC17_07250 [Alteromonas lipolytica]GGF86511.1 metallophosphatase [Alteromonas lipolytica]
MLSESQLQPLILARQVLPFRFGESVWLLDHRAAVYWPEQDCLLIADLHFEKGSFLSQYASPIPRYDSKSTLQTIAELITTYSPERVLCLGDSFHDIGAFSRLLPEDLQQLNTIVASVPCWNWLVGNHDPAIPASIPGHRDETLILITRGGKQIKCQHIPDTSDALQIAGHYHPKALLTTPVRRFRGKALVTTENLMLLPALGQYTGGLNIEDGVLTALAPKRARQCYLLCEQRVLALPKGS